MRTEVATTQITLRLTAICALLLCQMFATAAQGLELAEIEQRLGIPIPEHWAEHLSKELKTYNRSKRYKAMAIAMAPNLENAAVGRGYAAANVFQASALAMQACARQSQQMQINAPCEVVLSGNDLIMPGRTIRAGIGATSPSPVWRITGAKTDIFIVGSIHFLKATVLPLPQSIHTAFDLTERLALETNPVLFTDPQRASEIAQIMQGDAKENRALMDRRLKKALRSAFKPFGMKTRELEQLAPFATSLLLGQQQLMSWGYEGNRGIESNFVRQASSSGKPVIELEGYLDALKIMAETPLAIQVDVLKTTLEQLPNNPDHMAKLVRNWFAGDAEKLYELTVEQSSRTEGETALIRALIDGRNQTMWQNIQPILTDDIPTVIMVGSAHLGGEQGLLMSLQQAGYGVVQLSQSGDPIGI